MTMSIYGDDDGDRWRDFERKYGTIVPYCYDFIRWIIQGIGPGTPQHRRLFPMDNLSVHKNLGVIGLIIIAGH